MDSFLLRSILYIGYLFTFAVFTFAVHEDMTMSGAKRNVFVVFVFADMMILILVIQGSRPVISSTPNMNGW